MTLVNGSFEQPWTTFPTGNQQPAGWTLTTYAVGSQLIAPKAGAGDAIHDVRCIPECVHKLAIQLPANEQLGGAKALILDGVATYKLFGNSAFRVTLEQEFEIAKGARGKFVVPVNVHGNINPATGKSWNVDTGAAYWRVSVNGYPGQWNTFNNDFEDRTWLKESVSFSAVCGLVHLFIEFECHTLGGVSFFIDDVQFTSDEPQPQPTNTIPLGGYDRTYWVVPDEYTNLDRRMTIYQQAAIAQVTVGPSADDARAWATELIDAGNTVTAVNWDVPDAHKNAWKEYYSKREPRMIVEFRGGDPTPDPPPTGNEPQPIVHYSGNFVGLQHYVPPAGWLDYIKIAKPTVTKCFSCGDAIRAKQANPQMLSVWRKHVSDDGGWLVGDRLAKARQLVALYEAELYTTCTNFGISRAEALSWIDVIESLNETVPSNNADHIKAAVEFDVYFSERVAAVYGGAVKAGIMNVAVGNPLESEVELLLPCARESHEGRAILGYHSYWSADATQSYLDYAWPYHAGRWQEWDIVFGHHGLYPQYYLGECGICYSFPESNGAQFVPTRGWKSCGNFPNYISQIEDFNTLLSIWNEENQGRCHGGTLFISGHDGWLNFEIQTGDIALLREAMKVYA